MRILLFFILLGACGLTDPAIVARDSWTGARSVSTPEIEIFRAEHAIVVVRPTIVDSDAGRAYALLTNLRRQDANGPKIDRITALGVDLDYHRLDRLRTHCIDGCDRAETGVIYLSKDVFERAATTGLPLRIWGQRGRYSGTVPASAFQVVLAAHRDAG